MVVGRRYSTSSFPRYYIKMVRRFSGIASDDPKSVSVTAFAISVNWLNGFAPYSELRYKVLSILDKYGIPRSVSYAFMAFIQHAYKQLILKKNSTPDTMLDLMINKLVGNSMQAKYWGDKLDRVYDVIAEMFKLIGVNVALA